MDVSGASTVKTLKMNGRFNLHYDESPNRPGSATLTLDSWAPL